MLYYNFGESVEKFYRDVHIIEKIVKKRAKKCNIVDISRSVNRITHMTRLKFRGNQ